MRIALATLMIGVASVGAAAAGPARAPHVVPARVSPAGDANAVRNDRQVMGMRPLPTIKTYYPETYQHIAVAVDTAARSHQSDGEIAGTVAAMSNALVAQMSPYYDTNNTIEYMALSRDLLRAVVAEMPDACMDVMRSDGRMSAGARETLAALIAKQPVWRSSMIEAALRQAATAPVKPAVGAPNAIVVLSIRDVAYQSVPAVLRPYLHPIDAGRQASPRESEAACRFTGGIISATMELPPAQAAATFKLLSRADHGLWSVSERLIPAADSSAVLTVASRDP
jgi:hypothetical protein